MADIPYLPLPPHTIDSKDIDDLWAQYVNEQHHRVGLRWHPDDNQGRMARVAEQRERQGFNAGVKAALNAVLPGGVVIVTAPPTSNPCCCRYGAAVAGEWPEFGCHECPTHGHDAMTQPDELCKRHKKEKSHV